MKRMIITLALTLIAGSLWAADTLFFKITLLGMHCAGVEVIEQPVSEDVTEIIYHAFTVGGFDNIYKIDNWYHYYTDPDFTKLDSLKKNIKNRKMEQEYSENITDGLIRYSSGDNLAISRPVHHVLSSLSYLMHHPQYIRTGYEFPYDISDEGDLYDIAIRVEKNDELAQDEVYFTTTHIKGHELLEPTDVFNWMICAGKDTKMLAFSYKDHTITEGAFSIGFGGLHLRAKRIYK